MTSPVAIRLLILENRFTVSQNYRKELQYVDNRISDTQCFIGVPFNHMLNMNVDQGQRKRVGVPEHGHLQRFRSKFRHPKDNRWFVPNSVFPGQMTTSSYFVKSTSIPVTTVGSSPFQYFEMTTFSSLRASVNIPGTTVGSSPFQ